MSPFLLWSVQSRSAPCPPVCTKSRTGRRCAQNPAQPCARAQRQGDAQVRRPAHTETVGAERCMHTHGGAMGTRATLEPRPSQAVCPPPSHLQDGFPARCSYHAPNKSQLIRTLPLNRSPPLGCDQISARGRKRKPPALSSDSCCAAAPAEELPAGLQPLPPLSIMRGSQAGDRPLLRFGFQLGELQPRAA